MRTAIGLMMALWLGVAAGASACMLIQDDLIPPFGQVEDYVYCPPDSCMYAVYGGYAVCWEDEAAAGDESDGCCGDAEGSDGGEEHGDGGDF